MGNLQSFVIKELSFFPSNLETGRQNENIIQNGQFNRTEITTATYGYLDVMDHIYVTQTVIEYKTNKINQCLKICNVYAIILFICINVRYSCSLYVNHGYKIMYNDKL